METAGRLEQIKKRSDATGCVGTWGGPHWAYSPGQFPFPATLGLSPWKVRRDVGMRETRGVACGQDGQDGHNKLNN